VHVLSHVNEHLHVHVHTLVMHSVSPLCTDSVCDGVRIHQERLWESSICCESQHNVQ